MSKSAEDVRRAAFCKFFDGFQSTGEHCGVSIAESERELLELGFYAAWTRFASNCHGQSITRAAI